MFRLFNFTLLKHLFLALLKQLSKKHLLRKSNLFILLCACFLLDYTALQIKTIAHYSEHNSSYVYLLCYKFLREKMVIRVVSSKVAQCMNIYKLFTNSFTNLFFLKYFNSYFRSWKKVQRKILLALTSDLVGRSSCLVSSRRRHTKWVVSHMFEAKQIYMTVLHWFLHHSFHYHNTSTCFTLIYIPLLSLLNVVVHKSVSELVL